jgi:hypothetical protein
MAVNAVLNADDIYTKTALYNGDYLRDKATDDEKLDFLAVIEHGTPTRVLTVSQASRTDYRNFLVTVTHGLRHEGSFYAAEEPQVGRFNRRDGRLKAEALAERKFGQGLPEGVELHIIRHH